MLFAKMILGLNSVNLSLWLARATLGLFMENRGSLWHPCLCVFSPIWLFCNPTDKPTRFRCPWSLPARMLEWVAISCSRDSSRSRDGSWVSCMAGKFFTAGPLGKLGHCETIAKIICFYSWLWHVIVLSVCLLAVVLAGDPVVLISMSLQTSPRSSGPFSKFLGTSALLLQTNFGLPILTC